MKSFNPHRFHHCRLTFTCAVLLFAGVVAGITPVPDNDATIEAPENARVAPSSSASAKTTKISVKVTDFIHLCEKKQEGDFIIELTQTWQVGNGQGEDSKEMHLAMEEDTDSGKNSSKSPMRKMMMKTGIPVPRQSLSWVPEPVHVLKYRSVQVLSEQYLAGLHGHFSRLQRVKVSVACKTFYTLFPFDSHLCSVILFGGIGAPNTTSWSKDLESPPICKDLHSYQFRARAYSTIDTSPGPFVLNMILTRSTSMQIFGQMYSPVLLLCCLSFFTMSFGSFNFRISASMTCLLGLILITTLFWRDIPREHGGHQTAIEHYFVICIGITFQVVFTNILIYAYLHKPKSSSPSKQSDGGDVEANGTKPLETNNNDGICEDEKHILTMGKFHRFFYFKSLKPAKKHLPIAFVIINIIYWPIVLCLSSGLPNGFMYPTTDCS